MLDTLSHSLASPEKKSKYFVAVCDVFSLCQQSFVKCFDQVCWLWCVKSEAIKMSLFISVICSNLFELNVAYEINWHRWQTFCSFHDSTHHVSTAMEAWWFKSNLIIARLFSIYLLSLSHSRLFRFVYNSHIFFFTISISALDFFRFSPSEQRLILQWHCNQKWKNTWHPISIHFKRRKKRFN